MAYAQTANKLAPQDNQRSSKKQFVSELAAGSRVHSTFVLGGLESRIASNGTRYLVTQLKDRTGQIRGLEFDRVSFGDLPPVGSVVSIEGTVEGSRAAKRVKISSLLPTYDFESSDFIASSLRPLEEMSKEFAQRVKSISTSAYASLVRRVFHEGGIYKKFIEAPLSDNGRLAYRGAALERTLKLCDILDTLCVLYPQARKQLLLTSALLSEVGVVDCYELSATIVATNRGKSIPSSLLALSRIERAAENSHNSGAALAVESVLFGVQDSARLTLEKTLLTQARSLLVQADKAQEQDFAQGIVGL